MKSVSCIAVFVWLAHTSILNAGPILSNYGSGTPDGSWAYSIANSVGKGNDPFYVPLKSDAVGLNFEGYVYYPGGDGWLNSDSTYFDEDTIRVFRTFLLAGSDIVIPIAVGVDDGHSIYVNDVFFDGDGYGTESLATLILTAGVPLKLEILGYNGPGPSQFSVVWADNRLPIESTGQLQINANGNFTVVPEPISLVLFGVGVGVVTVSTTYRRRRGTEPTISRR